MHNISLKTSMIAPCGMNCALCLGYQRDKNHCPGCRAIQEEKIPYRVKCIIANCEKLKNSNSKFCFSCESFPCKRLRNLDLRYRTKYGMSMIENLGFIKSMGIRNFVAKEKEKWACTSCGELVCVHRPNCLSCGAEKKTVTF